MTRILVTGASGFVGSLLIPRLLADGHTVRALGRDPARVSAALAASVGEDDATLPSSPSLPNLPSATDLLAEVEVFRGDTLSDVGLTTALAGVDVAYYLIHSMERPSGNHTPFDEREQISARNFAASCARAGVTRIVYLGGLLPQDRTASRHLASRGSVERILLDAIPDSLALRASIVIGARSRSFRFLVRLVERLPVLTLPAWRSFRTQPIDERDVIALLAAAATTASISGSGFGSRSESVSESGSVSGSGATSVSESRSMSGSGATSMSESRSVSGSGATSMSESRSVSGSGATSVSGSRSVSGRSFDIGGPDVLTYGEMISRIADSMLVRRPVLGFGVNFTPLAGRVAAAIAAEDPELILPLMESLQGDLLPGDPNAAANAAELLGVNLHSFDSAVEHALRVWEKSEPLAAR
jgi:uncharacterized protein YbjT (DUF2867 family)